MVEYGNSRVVRTRSSFDLSLAKVPSQLSNTKLSNHSAQDNRFDIVYALVLAVGKIQAPSLDQKHLLREIVSHKDAQLVGNGLGYQTDRLGLDDCGCLAWAFRLSGYGREEHPWTSLALVGEWQGLNNCSQKAVYDSSTPVTKCPVIGIGERGVFAYHW